ncbi:MAG TPA: phosphotransferase [Gemmataceae bacterium]|nr:phosphotransferase [Gemmataceae bacterium]
MSADPLNAAALEVLRRYPRPLVGAWSGGHAPTRLQPLGNHGGFSGARLWRLDDSLCLRAWPADFPPQRLAFIHHGMIHARSAELTFTPRLFPAIDGTTAVGYAGRLWELQEWLPGEADYHRNPSEAKLRAALGALARLHECWQAILPPTSGVCPAVTRRLAVDREWRELVQSGWRPQAQADDPARSAAERAWRLLPGRIDSIPDLLRRWVDRSWPLQPCLCDVWHDHVLFDGDRVSGLIDYGAMKIDHPAVDVARLLGSLVDDDLTGWAMGLTAYRETRPLSADEAELTQTLDATGTIAAAAVWLRWLYHDGKEFEDRAAAARRLEGLTARLERIAPQGR